MTAIPKLDMLLLLVLMSLLASIQQLMWSGMMLQWQWDGNDGANNAPAWSTTTVDDDNEYANSSSRYSSTTAFQKPFDRQNKMRGDRDRHDLSRAEDANNYNSLKTIRTTTNNNHLPLHYPTDPTDPTPPPPNNIYLLGERNSGTNYAASILKKAFVPPNKNNIVDDPSRSHEAFSSDIPILKHKHMFRHSLLNETELREIARRTDILWILVVRRPCDWAEAMKRLPWHMCNATDIASDCPGEKFVGFQHSTTLLRYSLAEFMQLEWGDWPESSNFRNLSLVSDDFIYRNIFELRRHKLQLMKQIVDVVPRNVKIVRLHELELSPESMIQNLITEFNLKRFLRKNYRQQQPSVQQHREMCLSELEWEIAQREIDWEMEANFGYTFLDCHLCYGE